MLHNQALLAKLIMIQIPTNIKDNQHYIKNVERLLNDRIFNWTPKDLYVTRIDNWFDEKWVKFSGSIIHEISIHKLVDITIPPFHPNRVEKSELYRHENGDYRKQKNERPLHIIQESANNLKRKISDFSDNGLFFWYSGNTLANNKGSLMGYFVTDADCFTFYLTLAGEKNWNAEKAIGLTTKEIQIILGPELRAK